MKDIDSKMNDNLEWISKNMFKEEDLGLSFWYYFKLMKSYLSILIVTTSIFLMKLFALI